MWNNRNNLRPLMISILSIFLSPVYAQGITFEKGLSWQQIKDKAKMENKHIFVDCFATWCGPCKKMDKEVFPSEKVGTLLNRKFIAIKLQMDSTQQDNEQVRSWHEIAAFFLKEYNINALPTYLFFSPDGKIVTKLIGYQKVNDFINNVTDALNPDKQYYTLIERYQTGKKDYTVMNKLAMTALNFGDSYIAITIGRDYIVNYLSNLSESQLYTKDNIDFIQYFLSTKEKYFDLFYLSRNKIDSIMGDKGFAQYAIDRVIYKEKISPILLDAEKKNQQPDWNQIETSLKAKYVTDDVNRNILSAQLKWYEYKANWQKYGKTAVKWVDKYREHLNCYDLNDYAWKLFLHIHDVSILNNALSWSNQSINLCPEEFTPNYMDTKANILYKLGKTNEAIALEQHALKLANHLKNEHYVNRLTENIARMKKGKPTWIVSKSNSK